MTTHLNTKHYHNHIVWSAVSLEDGKKYHSNSKSYYTEVRALSDCLLYTSMLDVVCSKRAAIRIAGENMPAEVVKSRFLKLNAEHIQYVLAVSYTHLLQVREAPAARTAADTALWKSPPLRVTCWTAPLWM